MTPLNSRSCKRKEERYQVFQFFGFDCVKLCPPPGRKFPRARPSRCHHCLSPSEEEEEGRPCSQVKFPHLKSCFSATILDIPRNCNHPKQHNLQGCASCQPLAFVAGHFDSSLYYCDNNLKHYVAQSCVGPFTPLSFTQLMSTKASEYLCTLLPSA